MSGRELTNSGRADHSRYTWRFNEEELTAKDAKNAKRLAIFKAQGLAKPGLSNGAVFCRAGLKDNVWDVWAVERDKEDVWDV